MADDIGLRYVRDTLRHVSIATTSVHCTPTTTDGTAPSKAHIACAGIERPRRSYQFQISGFT